MTIEVTGIERPHRLASWSHLESIDICGALAFKPIEGGTRLSWEWKLEPHGCMRLLGPMLSRKGQRQEERIWTNLKNMLEKLQPETKTADAAHSRASVRTVA